MSEPRKLTGWKGNLVDSANPMEGAKPSVTTEQPGGGVRRYGQVQAEDGSMIDWGMSDSDEFTASGQGQQLVVTRTRYRLVGDLEDDSGSAGANEPVISGDKSLGEGGYSNDQPSATTPVEPEPAPSRDMFGLKFVYRYDGQEPYLTVEQSTLEGRRADLQLTGLAASVTYLMDLTSPDDSKFPTQVAAKFGQQSVDWNGMLQLGHDPVKTLVSLPGWRANALSLEAQSSEYFEPIMPTIMDVFFPRPERPAGAVAKEESAPELAYRLARIAAAGAWAVYGLGGPKGRVIRGVVVFAAAAGAAATDQLLSLLSDDWAAARKADEELEKNPTPDPDIHPKEETPDPEGSSTSQEDAPPPEDDVDDADDESGSGKSSGSTNGGGAPPPA